MVQSLFCIFGPSLVSALFGKMACLLFSFWGEKHKSMSWEYSFIKLHFNDGFWFWSSVVVKTASSKRNQVTTKTRVCQDWDPVKTKACPALHDTQTVKCGTCKPYAVLKLYTHGRKKTPIHSPLSLPLWFQRDIKIQSALCDRDKKNKSKKRWPRLKQFLARSHDGSWVLQRYFGDYWI